jgi:hypoxanthine phosphoribosyltransferase
MGAAGAWATGSGYRMGRPYVKIGKTLVSAEEIDAKLAELGAAISRDYEGKDLLLVGILKGAFVVMADLARHITIPVEFDFMAVSSYGSSTKSSGVVRIMKDLDQEIADRHVLIVEDIVDTGLTLHYLLKNLSVRKPASLKLVALLVKDGIERPPLEVEYEGFHIPPDFVVGYGLDYQGKYRNLPHVAIVDSVD